MAFSTTTTLTPTEGAALDVYQDGVLLTSFAYTLDGHTVDLSERPDPVITTIDGIDPTIQEIARFATLVARQFAPPATVENFRLVIRRTNNLVSVTLERGQVTWMTVELDRDTAAVTYGARPAITMAWSSFKQWSDMQREFIRLAREAMA